MRGVLSGSVVSAAKNPGSGVSANGQAAHTGAPSDEEGAESSKAGTPDNDTDPASGLYTDNDSPESKNQPNNQQMCSASGITGDLGRNPDPGYQALDMRDSVSLLLHSNHGRRPAESYFAMRKFSIEKDEDGIPRICLNGKVQFQNGVLDQGYCRMGCTQRRRMRH